ncbi:hypothetical protein G3I35_28565, partial [Streptomyces sp. SID10815]|nr:hypothetical protein [Streptomyces sp. SID10815]
MSMSSDLPAVPRTGDAPQGPPNVYHPQAPAAPAYEGYADPAAAHGWQNAYDRTRELPALTADVLAGRGTGGTGAGGAGAGGADAGESA